jgi:hypothetical protein
MEVRTDEKRCAVEARGRRKRQTGAGAAASLHREGAATDAEPTRKNKRGIEVTLAPRDRLSHASFEEERCENAERTKGERQPQQAARLRGGRGKVEAGVRAAGMTAEAVRSTAMVRPFFGHSWRRS